MITTSQLVIKHTLTHAYREIGVSAHAYKLKLNKKHFQKQSQLISFIKKCSFHVYSIRHHIHGCHQKTESKAVRSVTSMRYQRCRWNLFQ